jgi:hypothetical protein
MARRPLTIEEMSALPIGPEFGSELRVIDGAEMLVPIARPVQPVYFGPDERCGYSDVLPAGSFR